MKKLLALVIAAAMIMTCSLALADRLDDIKAAGKLSVATSPDWPPYEYIDDAGNVAGTDIKMVQYFADQLGVELDIQQMSFDSCLAAVATKKVDMAVAGLTYDEERTVSMDLVGVYWSEGDQGLLVRKGEGAAYAAPENFAGKKVAAQNGTIQQNLVADQLADANLELITKIPDGVNMLKAGRVDALAVPKTVYDSILAENDDLEIAACVLAADGGNYVAVVKDEAALAAEVQKMIDTINAAGLYAAWMDEVVANQNAEKAAQ